MIKKFLWSIAFVAMSSQAQVSIRIIDASTGEPLPYANLNLNKAENRIANAEGYVQVPDVSADMITISFFGYGTKVLSLTETKNTGGVVALYPVAVQLEEVKVKNPDPLVIMTQVRKNLKSNYARRAEATSSKLFVRQTDLFEPANIDIQITESSGFSKASLKQANSAIASFTSINSRKPPKEYTDMLCEYYQGIVSGNPPTAAQKLKVYKAVKLKDQQSASSLEELQKKATEIFFQHLDTSKYYRVKSGWFGSKDTISLKKDDLKKKPKTEMATAKTKLNTYLFQNNLLNPEFEFIHKPELYQFSYDGAVYLPDGNFAYVLKFKPRKSSALYSGKLYVCEDDFAVLRVDYDLVAGKKTGGVNMKFLLGVKVLENVSKGTLIYKTHSSGKGYVIQYASREKGQYLYLNRPIKFIEIADASEKDVVAFDLKLEGTTANKVELLGIDHQVISLDQVQNLKEEEFKYTYLKQYDPGIWQGQAGIEPLEEMKRFKTSDEAQ
jgi:hypothetical protein